MAHTQCMVTKSDGSSEPFQPEKVHQVLFWATEDLANVSVSQIEMKAQLQIFEGIRTRDIMDIMIKSAVDLITEDTPNYQYAAARLRLFQLRKQVFGQFDPIPLYNIVSKNVENGHYTKELLEWYSPEDFAQMDSIIKHNRDFDYAYAGITQFINKYLVQNRVTGEVFETPQIANILIAATIFHRYAGQTRMKMIRDFYNHLSNFDFSLPSPIMAGVRTPVKQFSSCVLLETGDSLDSINRVAAGTVNYASKKAGIGIHAGHIRAVGSEIRNGDAKHTGVTPFYRYFQGALKSCSQGGMRGASATLYAPWFHYEIETIMVLKNNKGTDDDRVRKLDYAILRNRLLFKRFLKGEKLTLFSPDQVPDLVEAFYTDQDEFERLYEKYERTRGLKKKKITAEKWFDIFHTERKETGRLYYFNVDHGNDHGAFDPQVKPIKQSNLCLEIALPCVELGKFETRKIEIPFDGVSEYIDNVIKLGGIVKSVAVNAEEQQVEVVYDENLGRIQLCTLAAYNLGNLKNVEDMRAPLRSLVFGLNELLDYQDYPQVEAYLATMEHRPLGIGVSNLAYFLAKNDLHYGDPAALERWDEVMEAFQYYLIEASMEVAKERGEPCSRFSDTKYSKGVFPIDTYCKGVDELVQNKLRLDWEELKKQVAEYGMMNATLSAQMPVESSALIINATNGLEPPKSLVSEKENSGAIVKQVVPGIHHLKNKYDLLWDMPDCLGYLKMVAVQQKHIDQAISANTFFNPEHFVDEETNPDGNIPMTHMLTCDLLSYKWGIKTGYYCHTYDGAGDETEERNNGACDSGACAV